MKNDVRSFLYGCYCCRCCCCFLSRRHSANFFMLNFSLFTRFILFGVRIVSHRIQLNKSFCRGVMLSDFGYGFPFQWILHTYFTVLHCVHISFFSFRDFFFFSSDARNHRNFHPQCQRKILHIKHSIDVLFKQMFHPNAHIYSNKINNVFILFASFRSIFALFHTIVALFIC